MIVDYEAVVDSDQDIVDLGRKLYLPHGSAFVNLYKSSPWKAQQIISKQIEENQQLYYYDKGLPPYELEVQMIREGSATILGSVMALSLFGLLEQRHGYQPMRISKGENQQQLTF